MSSIRLSLLGQIAIPDRKSSTSYLDRIGASILQHQRSESFQFGPVRFSLMTRQRLQQRTREWLDYPTQSMVITLTGAHGVHESKMDAAVRRAHQDADIVLCDGTPPYVAAVMSGLRGEVDRIPGRDATAIIAALAAEKEMFQFFMGGPPGLASKAMQGLGEALGSSLQGDHWSPPFSSTVTAEMVDQVVNALTCVPTPAVVWIGLSTPKQELLARELKRRLPNEFLFVCVGAAFDMYAGTKPSAPARMSRMGLEWLYRSLQEPRRLPARYLRASPTVLAALAGAGARGITSCVRRPKVARTADEGRSGGCR